jgi:hypothetical protein
VGSGFVNKLDQMESLVSDLVAGISVAGISVAGKARKKILMFRSPVRVYSSYYVSVVAAAVDVDTRKGLQKKSRNPT